MKQITIGLSGHIDHGKTSIVKCLTGKNTDNLKDEIERGMTIDIGFAHFNKNISLIDVPGHEKFVKNMVAGVSAIDSVILVIAADDGIMPQTKEHFEILKILKINSGIVVINKIDLVDEEWLELIELEVKKFVENTFLNNANIIKVSTIDNIGIDNLKKEILNISTIDNNRFDRGIFRMFIDRVFTKKGFGTVVTGTVESGKISKGKQLQILPDSEKVNVRDIHSHDNIVSKLSLGDRGAINLQSVNKDILKRGFHLGEYGYFDLVSNAVCFINTASDLKHNQRIRVHLGTQEVMARVYFVSNDITKTMVGLLKFENKIVASYRDKFIIRTYSPVTTIGGGEIIDVNINGKWNQNKLYINQFSNRIEESEIVEKIIQRDDTLVFKKSSLCKHLSISILNLNSILLKINNLRYYAEDDPWIISSDQYINYSNKICGILTNLHNQNPYNKGFLLDEINNAVLLPDDLLKMILFDMCKENKIKVENDLYSKYEFQVNLSKDKTIIKDKLVDILHEDYFQTLTFSELGIKVNQSEDIVKKLLYIEKSNNNIIIINGEIIFTVKNYNKMLDNLKIYFKNNDSLSVGDFKKIINSSRKYAVPLLEYLDKQKITYRIGNERKINKK